MLGWVRSGVNLKATSRKTEQKSKKKEPKGLQIGERSRWKTLEHETAALKLTREAT